jgi:Uma2 family endonuclease
MIVALKSEKSLMTVDEFYDFVNRPENQARFFELVRGEVIEVSRPRRIHCIVCGNVARILGNYTFRKKKGYIATNDTGVVLDRDPDTVRGPDVAYFDDAETWDELPEKWGDTVPRLIVDVLSPSDTAKFIHDKINDYFRNGVEVIWLIDSDSKRVNIYSKTEGVKSVTEKDTLTGGDVLPGFRCKVADFFALPAGAKKPKRKKPS